jgi:hypothetical protein
MPKASSDSRCELRVLLAPAEQERGPLAGHVKTDRSAYDPVLQNLTDNALRSPDHRNVP